MLNVLPWGKPAMFELYRKTAGKSAPFTPIPINTLVKDELLWLQKVIPSASGIKFVDSLRWSDDEADMIMWSDANLCDGIAFVFAGHGFVYKIVDRQNLSASDLHADIFFLEQIGILSALHHAANQ
ncbi:hypothetical protein AB1N83_014103 [Pleurotus pulmonarius]